MRRYPDHNLPVWMEVHIFHQGLNQNTCQFIDSAVGGSLGNNTPEVAKKLIEEIIMNNYRWNSKGRSVSKPTGILEVSEDIVLGTQVEALKRRSTTYPPRNQLQL